MGSPDCDGMYSKLMDDEASYFEEANLRPDAGLSVSPGRVAPRVSGPAPGPGPYRLATLCLATLCAVLLISIIAVTAHYKNIPHGGGDQTAVDPEAQIQKQKQEVNITSLTAAIVKLQREKDELQVKLAARTATTAPEVTRPTTAPPVVCPPNWLLFNSSCYYISRQSSNWPDSQTFCQSKGGHLAIIHTAEEQSFLWELLPRGHWNAYWFGISDGHTEEEWKWVDGTRLVGGFWEDGEPNNHIDEDCGYIIKTRILERVAVKSWYDAPCSMYWPFICEKEMAAAAITAAPQ
ncbi:uncharacterized protein ACN63O_018126 [Diretmus argenteus]